jgi:hypothetical protein
LGGRRSYSIKDVVGSKRKIIKETRKLKEAIGAGEPREIARTSTQLILKSDYSINNLAKSVKLTNFILEGVKKKPVSYEYGKKLASEEWSSIKKQQDITIPRKIDRIFVDSAASAIRRRKK